MLALAHLRKYGNRYLPKVVVMWSCMKEERGKEAHVVEKPMNSGVRTHFAAGACTVDVISKFD